MSLTVPIFAIFLIKRSIKFCTDKGKIAVQKGFTRNRKAVRASRPYNH